MRSHPEWQGRRVAVFGAARSGVAAANLLVELGAEVVLSDTLPDPKPEGLDPRVRVLGGGNRLEGATVLVPSPGIPPSAPALRDAQAAGVRIVSEIELGASVATAPIVAITGTDGKSTTTEMIGAVIRAAGRPAVVAGNIGDPLCARARDVGPEGVLVVEVSEFQLWSCGHFRPRVAVVTNVAEDHADYFVGDPDGCARAMERCLADLGAGDVAILRRDDARVMAFGVPAGVEVVGFGPRSAPLGWGFDGLHLTRDGLPVMLRDALPLPGVHNGANALCALAAGVARGLPLAPMTEALRVFQGLPHRLELVRVRRGVRYVDDSKATNPHAAAVGLRAVEGAVLVITGGYDKGLDLEIFVREVLPRARHVVLTGPTADRMEAALAGRVGASRAVDMREAVAQAASRASPGDTVLLSPAASSFDAYRSYHHRGQVFRAEVEALPD